MDELLDAPGVLRALPGALLPAARTPVDPDRDLLAGDVPKHRYRLGYETLCREVADSICWSRFCRIPLGTTVPHPSTLGKITARCGPEVIEALNRALLVKAAGEKVVKLDKVRADTTVVEANVAYPTDSGLLVRAITLIVALVARIHAAGAASRTTVRDRRRAAGRRARSISAHLKLRNEQAKERVLAITGELADLAEAMIGDATRVLVNAGRHLHRQGEGAAGRLQAAVAELDTILDRAGRVMPQTRTRLSGITPASATRLVSLHDPDARPIAKGRLGKPVEFGYKASSPTTPTGSCSITARTRQSGRRAAARPGDRSDQESVRHATGAVTADRGYGEAKVDETLTGLGVNTVVIPRKGRPSAARRQVEHGRGFRRLVKWRTGSEGRISYLKRRYGLDRALFDGLTGARTWCGLGVLSHNSVKIAALVQARRTGTTGHLARRVVTGQVEHVPARPCVPGPAATRTTRRSTAHTRYRMIDQFPALPARSGTP